MAIGNKAWLPWRKGIFHEYFRLLDGSLVGNLLGGLLGGPAGILAGGALLGGLFAKKPKRANPNAQLSELLAGLSPIVKSELSYMGEMQPLRQQALRRWADSLDPTKAGGRVGRFRQQAYGSAVNSALNSPLANNRTFGPDMRSALLLDAANRADSAGNRYSADMFGPAGLAQSYMALSSALDPRSLSGGLGMETGLLQALAGIQAGSSHASFLDSLLPIIGALAPSIDWGKVKL